MLKLPKSVQAKAVDPQLNALTPIINLHHEVSMMMVDVDQKYYQLTEMCQQDPTNPEIPAKRAEVAKLDKEIEEKLAELKRLSEGLGNE